MSKDVFVLFPTVGKTREQNEEMLSAVNERLFRDGYLPTHNVNGMVDPSPSISWRCWRLSPLCCIGSPGTSIP